MINLTKINKINKAYTATDNELLFLGIFQDKKFSPKQRSLDVLLENRLSKAIEVDRFTGKKDTQLLIYGNASIKRIVLTGLGDQKKYTNDRARSVASDLTRYVNSLQLSEFSVDGDSFGLQKNVCAQAFAEGIVLGAYEFKDYKTKKDEDVKANSVTNIWKCR